MNATNELLAQAEALISRVPKGSAPGPYKVIRHDNSGGDINWQLQAGECFWNSSDIEGPRARATTYLLALSPEWPPLLRALSAALRAERERGERLQAHAEAVAEVADALLACPTAAPALAAACRLRDAVAAYRRDNPPADAGKEK